MCGSGMLIPAVLYCLVITVSAYLIKQLMSPGDNLVKYQLKMLIFPFLTSCLAIVCIPLFAFNPKNVKNCLYVSYILRYITKLLGIEWELRKGHILAEDRGCVIVANHQSMIDILGMFNFWDVMGKCASIARKEVFYVMPFGLAAYLAGVVFIDRSSPKNSYRQLEITSNLMIQDKTKIWLFPEGTRNKKRGLLPFRRGAFKIAIAAQVPIIPVVYSPYYFINRDKHFFGHGKMIVTCLEPVETRGLTEDDIGSLMERTRSLMEQTYAEVAKEVLAPLPADYPLTPE